MKDINSPYIIGLKCEEKWKPVEYDSAKGEEYISYKNKKEIRLNPQLIHNITYFNGNKELAENYTTDVEIDLRKNKDNLYVNEEFAKKFYRDFILGGRLNASNIIGIGLEKLNYWVHEYFTNSKNIKDRILDDDKDIISYLSNINVVNPIYLNEDYELKNGYNKIVTDTLGLTNFYSGKNHIDYGIVGDIQYTVKNGNRFIKQLGIFGSEVKGNILLDINNNLLEPNCDTSYKSKQYGDVIVRDMINEYDATKTLKGLYDGDTKTKDFENFTVTDIIYNSLNFLKDKDLDDLTNYITNNTYRQADYELSKYHYLNKEKKETYCAYRKLNKAECYGVFTSSDEYTDKVNRRELFVDTDINGKIVKYIRPANRKGYELPVLRDLSKPLKSDNIIDEEQIKQIITHNNSSICYNEGNYSKGKKVNLGTVKGLKSKDNYNKIHNLIPIRFNKVGIKEWTFLAYITNNIKGFTYFGANSSYKYQDAYYPVITNTYLASNINLSKLNKNLINDIMDVFNGTLKQHLSIENSIKNITEFSFEPTRPCNEDKYIISDGNCYFDDLFEKLTGISITNFVILKSVLKELDFERDTIDDIVDIQNTINGFSENLKNNRSNVSLILSDYEIENGNFNRINSHIETVILLSKTYCKENYTYDYINNRLKKDLINKITGSIQDNKEKIRKRVELWSCSYEELIEKYPNHANTDTVIKKPKTKAIEFDNSLKKQINFNFNLDYSSECKGSISDLNFNYFKNAWETVSNYRYNGFDFDVQNIIENERTYFYDRAGFNSNIIKKYLFNHNPIPQEENFFKTPIDLKNNTWELAFMLFSYNVFRISDVILLIQHFFRRLEFDVNYKKLANTTGLSFNKEVGKNGIFSTNQFIEKNVKHIKSQFSERKKTNLFPFTYDLDNDIINSIKEAYESVLIFNNSVIHNSVANLLNNKLWKYKIFFATYAILYQNYAKIIQDSKKLITEYFDKIEQGKSKPEVLHRILEKRVVNFVYDIIPLLTTNEENDFFKLLKTSDIKEVILETFYKWHSKVYGQKNDYSIFRLKNKRWCFNYIETITKKLDGVSEFDIDKLKDIYNSLLYNTGVTELRGLNKRFSTSPRALINQELVAEMFLDAVTHRNMINKKMFARGYHKLSVDYNKTLSLRDRTLNSMKNEEIANAVCTYLYKQNLKKHINSRHLYSNLILVDEVFSELEYQSLEKNINIRRLLRWNIDNEIFGKLKNRIEIDNNNKNVIYKETQDKIDAIKNSDIYNYTKNIYLSNNRFDDVKKQAIVYLSKETPRRTKEFEDTNNNLLNLLEKLNNRHSGVISLYKLATEYIKNNGDYKEMYFNFLYEKQRFLNKSEQYKYFYKDNRLKLNTGEKKAKKELSEDYLKKIDNINETNIRDNKDNSDDDFMNLTSNDTKFKTIKNKDYKHSVLSYFYGKLSSLRRVVKKNFNQYRKIHKYVSNIKLNVNDNVYEILDKYVDDLKQYTELSNIRDYNLSLMDKIYTDFIDKRYFKMDSINKMLESITEGTKHKDSNISIIIRYIKRFVKSINDFLLTIKDKYSSDRNDIQEFFSNIIDIVNDSLIEQEIEKEIRFTKSGILKIKKTVLRI